MSKNKSNKTIAVAVVEDDPGLRQSLRKILEDAKAEGGGETHPGLTLLGGTVVTG